MRFMRLREVLKETGKSRSRLYDEVKSGEFPKPVKIGKHAVAWLENEVTAWQRARIAERDKAA